MPKINIPVPVFVTPKLLAPSVIPFVAIVKLVPLTSMVLDAPNVIAPL